MQHVFNVDVSVGSEVHTSSEGLVSTSGIRQHGNTVGWERRILVVVGVI